MTEISQEPPILNGRYELHRRIARGGMADVFLARDKLLDRPVAVKVLFAQYAAEPTFVARFRREAQAAAKLNHPSIVAVYDWGQHEDTYFIVMEFIEGHTLADLIASEGHLDPIKASQIAADVAGALGFAHRNGTVHRDVKPGNIMITRDGQVKVADFGIARAFGGGDDELTQTGSVMGTASYFSPEQAQGKNVDPRSDLYALGIVLFEMTSGSTPFEGDTPVAIAYKHVQDPVPMVTTRNPAVPQPLAQVINQLMQKDPRARYPAAEDVRVDLNRFIEHKPLIGLKGATVAGSGDVASADQTLIADPTAVMPAASAGRHSTGSTRAVIDTTRAVPVTAAVKEVEAVEEYYEPPSRTGVFVVVVSFLALALVGIIFAIIQVWSAGGDAGDNDEVEVLNVIGQTFDEAKSDLEADGFVVDFIFEESNEPENQVLDQDPKGRAMVDFGSEVVLTLSEPANLITVPPLDDFSYDNAITFLSNQFPDLNVERQDVSDPGVDAGFLVRIDPVKGTEISASGTLTLFVSEGTGLLEIPNIVGKNKAAAIIDLTDAGFTAAVSTDDRPSADVAIGNVISVNPEVGSEEEPDVEIELIISSGNENISVRDVGGMTVEEATKELEEYGFEVNPTQFQDTNNEADFGKVISQLPAFPSTVNLPFKVTIVVGRQGGTATTPTTAPEDTTTSSTEPEDTTTSTDPDATTEVTDPE